MSIFASGYLNLIFLLNKHHILEAAESGGGNLFNMFTPSILQNYLINFLCSVSLETS